jgi:hypothetical protein
MLVIDLLLFTAEITEKEKFLVVLISRFHKLLVSVPSVSSVANLSLRSAIEIIR